MCGICGIAGANPVDSSVLESMAEALRHRGPDSDGFYLSPSTEGISVGLGFRRLSIIDLVTGDQPLANEDGTIWIVFNGEIYNFRELRRELESRGHRFRTHSDTEAIVHLYEERGPRCVEQLSGMFAFGIWDERLRQLTLARDRFGKKPLYYAPTKRGLIFASELKALLRHPDCPRTVDDVSLGQFLAHEYVPAPRTIIAGVFKLPRAHILTWRDGRIDISRYWELPSTPDDPPQTDTEYIEEFRELLWAAVRRRLVADVPLGALLSGGIDSSSVVAAMVDLMPADAVKTFSIGFAEPSFDESAHARAVARHFGTDHYEQTFTSREMLDLLPSVGAFLDEPLADPSILPTYLLSGFAREHVTVALGGDGGDELLAGYPTYPADRVAQLIRLPRFVRSVLERGADLLPVSTSNFSFDFKVRRFLRGLEFPADLRHAAWLGAFTPAEQLSVLCNPQGDPFAAARRSMAVAPNGDRLTSLIHYYVDGYLQDDILAKVDRASMACSLEVRAPFLDLDLVEFLGRVPSRLKLHGSETKFILKRATGDRLPPRIAERPKKGFGIPVAEWLKKDLSGMLTDELAPDRLARQGFFRPAAVTELVREHLEGRRDHRKQLWTLLSFQLWHEAYLGPQAQAAADRRVA